MKITRGAQNEIVLIPTIEIYKCGYEKKHRHFGSMVYYMTFKWFKCNITVSKEYK